uniref:SDR family NAD(P)-dependent oxidoreductase n=1 Tax=Rhizobium sp. RCAM05350 TaxID=2895568 RepID=UPI0020767CD9|nr:SDR family NAD(P)-dependent oxidoreductase [Rhizobium sp. RCAM05350]
MTPDFSVAGKTVLITGGTGGIGSEFAKAFLAHGANVIVADMAQPKADMDTRIRYEPLDVTSDEAVEGLAARIVTLDVVIHCAGKLALGRIQASRLHQHPRHSPGRQSPSCRTRSGSI